MPIEPESTYRGALDQVLVVAVAGPLDHEAAEPVRRAVEAGLPDRDDASVVLDLAAVDLLTSIGIAALLEVREFCADRGAPLRLAGLTGEPRRLLAMLRLEGKFTLDDAVDDAVAVLG